MEEILWKDAIKIPFPEWIMSVFWQVMTYFWTAEMDPSFYRLHSMPRSVGDVRLRVDNEMCDKIRYHLLPIPGDEVSGVLDESPFWIDYPYTSSLDHPVQFLEHGDFRHSYQMFLQSFLRSIRSSYTHHHILRLIHKMISKNVILSWRCGVCKKYKKWSIGYIEEEFLNHGVSISPTTLLFLLSHGNDALKQDEDANPDEAKELVPILKTALHRFFLEFEKIYNQTTMDPTQILAQLIHILRRHTATHGIEDIGKIEVACSRDMKDYLFRQFKFLKTKSIKIAYFPRDMLIARDVFVSIVRSWKRQCPDTKCSKASSPGMFLFFYYIVFPDRALEKKIGADDLLVAYGSSILDPPMIRHMTPPEIQQFSEYHPLLRPNLFT